MGSSSKTGWKLRPPLVLFHTPPLAEPTQTTLGSPGMLSTSATRPVMLTGPTLRHSRWSKGVGSFSSGAVTSAAAERARRLVRKRERVP